MVEREQDSCTQSKSTNYSWERGDLPNPGGEFLSSVDAGDLCPCRLINTNTIEDFGELVTVLGIVDHLRISSQNVNTTLLEPKGDVLRELS